MDILQEVIQSLDATQQKEFVYFIQRNKYRKGRKDLKLFTLFTQDTNWEANVLMQQLMVPNLNAYHTIRKRLFAHLADFITLKSVSKDADSYSHVNALLAVVNYLFDKQLATQAWKYLTMAEQLAIQHEYYDLLNSVYLLQLQKLATQDNLTPDEVIKKFQQNKVELEQNEQLKISLATLRYQLQKEKQFSAQSDYLHVIKNTIKSLNLSKKTLKKPRVALDFVKVIRTAITNEKNYHYFEPLLIKYFQNCYTGKKAADKTANPTVYIEFCYLLAHTFYRNKKFDASINYINLMFAHLKNCPIPFQKEFTAKSKLLKAANLMFSAELNLAVNEIEQLMQDDKLSKEVLFNAQLNAVVYYFLQASLKKAQLILAQFQHSKQWYAKIMGAEWVVKKDLIELLLFIDLGETDLIFARIKSFERYAKNKQKTPSLERAWEFFSLVKHYYLKKDTTYIQTFAPEKLSFLRFEEEDLQAILFYAWLKSKIENNELYTSVLQLVHQ